MKIHLNIKNERKKIINDFERISGSIFGKVYPSKYEYVSKMILKVYNSPAELTKLKASCGERIYP